jgi:hypothetical protein
VQLDILIAFVQLLQEFERFRAWLYQNGFKSFLYEKQTIGKGLSIICSYFQQSKPLPCLRAFTPPLCIVVLKINED